MEYVGCACVGFGLFYPPDQVGVIVYTEPNKIFATCGTFPTLLNLVAGGFAFSHVQSPFVKSVGSLSAWSEQHTGKAKTRFIEAGFRYFILCFFIQPSCT